MSGAVSADAVPLEQSGTARVTRTLGLVYGANALNLVGGQAFTLLLFALFSPTQVGLINWGTAAGGIIFYIADLGIETSLVVALKEHPVRRSSAILLVGMIRLLTAGLLGSVWAAATIAQWLTRDELTILLLIGLGLAARSFQTPFSAYLQVNNRQATVAFVQTVSVALRFCGIFLLLLANGLSVMAVLLSMLAADLAGLATVAAVALRHGEGAIRSDLKPLVMQMLRSAPIVSISQALLAGQNRLDWLIIAALASHAALANYALANKALDLLTLAGSIFGRNALPWLVDGWSPGLLRNVRLLHGALMGSGLLLAVLGLPVLRLLFGDKYDDAGRAIPVLAALAPSLGMYQVAQFASFAGRRAHYTVVSGALGLIAQVIVDLATIPEYGILGAAFGMAAYASVALPVQLGMGLRTVTPPRVALEMLAGAAVLPAILGVAAVLHIYPY